MDGSRKVLIVEDEPTLRQSMVRGLRRLNGVDVSSAATTREAKLQLASEPPDLLISDLDLPDGSGLEVVAEAERLGLRLPVMFVSAFLGRFKGSIPQRSDVHVYEKPLSMERLRAMVEAHVRADTESLPPSPFAVTDYVQLASLGRYSVVIDVRSSQGDGQIVLQRGELWSARDEQGGGVDAFRRLVFRTGARVSCRTLHNRDLGERDIDGSAESVLLDAARELDEQPVPPGAPAPKNVWDDEATARTRLPPPPSTPAQAIGVTDERMARPLPPPPANLRVEPRKDVESFERAFEAGVDALLAKDYPRAHEAFVEASRFSPTDRRVVANLARLRALGIP
ncbi:MAG TPA: response regulator [Polyangiales bacterium]